MGLRHSSNGPRARPRDFCGAVAWHDAAEASAESFPAQLKGQLEKSAVPTQSVNAPLALAQHPPGLQAPGAPACADAALPINSAVDIYRRFEAM
jgi:hypothetical protein